MTLISVVVPMYDVEDYLDECLQSLAAQTVADFEAVLVDDGSTDSSAAIAARYAAGDPRFRVLRQPNGGLSRARNAGIEAASGEYLAFLDGDDVLPPDAYQLLLGALERSGSDFATGNVQRLTATGCSQAAFLAGTFARTRLRTHVRRFAPLLLDRTAWNKLWRRSFWGGRRFPEGRLHEDIPVVLPAHFEAASVDVVSAPVYRWRVRERGAPSITQRRGELRALRDRIAAVRAVHGYVAAHESARLLRRYQRTIVAHDLRYHLDLLLDVDAEYRALFMEFATAFLASAGSRVSASLPAIDRAKYALIRRGRLDELLELLAFERQAALSTPPRRRRGRYYAAYPLPAGMAAPRLGRRDRELALTAHLEDVRFERGRLRLAGYAAVNALGAESPDSQQVQIAAVRAAAGRRRALRMRVAPRPLSTIPARRGDLDPRLRWAGFRASIDPADLLDGDAWELFAAVRCGSLRRRRAVFAIADPWVVRTIDVPAPGPVLMRAAVTADGRASVTVARRWARIERHRRIGATALELSGRARLDSGAAASLTLAGTAFPLALDGAAFSVRVEPTELAGADWELGLVAGSERLPLSLSERLSGAAWRSGGRELALERTRDGGGRLVLAELAGARSADRPAVVVAP